MGIANTETSPVDWHQFRVFSILYSASEQKAIAGLADGQWEHGIFAFCDWGSGDASPTEFALKNCKLDKLSWFSFSEKQCQTISDNFFKLLDMSYDLSQKKDIERSRNRWDAFMVGFNAPAFAGGDRNGIFAALLADYFYLKRRQNSEIQTPPTQIIGFLPLTQYNAGSPKILEFDRLSGGHWAFADVQQAVTVAIQPH
jgi:hypothetical protein